MARTLKDITFSWEYTGSTTNLKGFNVAITLSGNDPKTEAIQSAFVEAADPFSSPVQYILYDVVSDTSNTYSLHVQTVFEGSVSGWSVSTNISVTDDGSKTIETTSGAQSKANTAESNAKTEITNRGLSSEGDFAGTIESEATANIKEGATRARTGLDSSGVITGTHSLADSTIIEGGIIRTSSSGMNVQLNGTTDALEFIDSGGIRAAAFQWADSTPRDPNTTVPGHMQFYLNYHQNTDLYRFFGSDGREILRMSDMQTLAGIRLMQEVTIDTGVIGGSYSLPVGDGNANQILVTDGQGQVYWGDMAGDSHNHDSRYYTESEVDTLLSGKADTGHTHSYDNYGGWTPRYSNDAVNFSSLPQVGSGGYLNLVGGSNIDLSEAQQGQLAIAVTGVAQAGHNHDSRYYLQSEVDDGFAVKSHTHDSRYYTQTEVDNALSGKSNTGHAHAYVNESGDTMTGNLTFHDGDNGKRLRFFNTNTNKSDVGGIQFSENAGSNIHLEMMYDGLNGDSGGKLIFKNLGNEFLAFHRSGRIDQGTSQLITSSGDYLGLWKGSSSPGSLAGSGMTWNGSALDVDSVAVKRIHLTTTTTAGMVQGSSNAFAVSWNQQEYIDSDVYTHSTSTNTGTVTVDTAGVYKIYANMMYENTTGSARNTPITYIKVNGVEITSTRTADYDRGSSYGKYSNNSVYTVLSLSANDTIEIWNYAHNEDGTQYIVGSDCEFIIERIGTEAASNTWRPIDGSPIGGHTTTSISSNWAANHQSDSDAHHSRYTDEEVRDVVAAALSGSGNVSITHDDANNVIKIDDSHNHDGRYYTESEVDTKLNSKSNTGHSHTEADITDLHSRYTDSEAISAVGGTINDSSTQDTYLWSAYKINNELSNKSNTGHTHDGRYYTESEIDTKLAGKSNTGHTHSYLPLSGGTLTGDLLPTGDQVNIGGGTSRFGSIFARTLDFDYSVGINGAVLIDSGGDYKSTWQGNSPSDFASSGHNHDGRYYTKSQSDSNYANAGHTHDSRYVKESGDTMTGDLDFGGNKAVFGNFQIVYNSTENSLDFVVV